ncbi:MAG: YciI family protein [Rhodospirillaceae bacterium]|nr:MAG: YciI family protein [Rhodospirillaceae bacterium]
MLITIIALDKPGHQDLRMKTRPDHLKWIADKVPPALFIGPILADDGVGMMGSLYIVEFEDLATARAFQKGDPYNQVGLFERVIVQPTRNLAVPKP